MMYHFVWLRGGYELHISSAYSEKDQRDHGAMQFWAHSKAQVQVQLWPAERERTDAPLTIGQPYKDEELEELYEESK